MQIFGIAKDNDGVKCYMVKNSWGEASTFELSFSFPDFYQKFHELYFDLSFNFKKTIFAN